MGLIKLLTSLLLLLALNFVCYQAGKNDPGQLVRACNVLTDRDTNPLLAQYGPSCEVRDGRVVVVITNPQNKDEYNTFDVLTKEIKHFTQEKK